MTRTLASIASMTALLVCGVSTTARAYCGVYALSSGGGVAVIGEDDSVRGTLAICHRLPSGTRVFVQIPSCGNGTPAGEMVKITDAGSNFSELRMGLVVEPGGINCATATGAHWIRPFPASFLFGLRFTGYKGKDFVYGTPNNDELWTDSYSIPAPVGGPYDPDPEPVCGYGGNDFLGGDYSPANRSQEDCLNGGAGNDVCHGGPDTLGQDTAYSCETNYSVVTPVDLNTCGCGTAQPPLW
jgi:hypothetical protein